MKFKTPWYECHVDFVDHPKLFMAAKSANVSHAVLANIIQRLWSWAVWTNNIEGILHLPDEEIARLIRWDEFAPKQHTVVGTPTYPVAHVLLALANHGWLEKQGNEQFYRIQDWETFGAKSINARISGGERARRSKERADDVEQREEDARQAESTKRRERRQRAKNRIPNIKIPFEKRGSQA